MENKVNPPTVAATTIGGSELESKAKDADAFNNNFTATEVPEQANLTNALDYAKRGWKVVPLHTPDAQGNCSCRKAGCGSVGKHPRTMNGLKDATTDEAKIRGWWGMWPDANIGIATGAGSNLVVLDVDPRHYGDKSLAVLEDECGELPPTLCSRTGGDGLHYLFTYPAAEIKNSAGRLGAGLDIRGEGGYIVAPPSLHQSGKRYVWAEAESPLSQMPDWMLHLLTENRRAKDVDPSQSQRKERQPITSGECIPEGQRNDALFRLGCSLRDRGLDEPEILAALLSVNERRCEPSLQESEVESIASSCGRYEPTKTIAGEDEGNDLYEPLGQSWKEFSRCEFFEAEKVLSELERGEVGLLVAATNIGKTTLSLNLALMMAAGASFHPIVRGKSNGYRVMYVDGETRKARFQRDVKRMMRDWLPVEHLMVAENLFVMCDAELGGEPLNLSNEKHMRAIVRAAEEFKPDLIIVDTLSALFNLFQENDNAEMTKRVMKPLAKLAKDTNSAILLLHHIGKQNEDAQAGVKAYRGRGASASGASARMVLLLTQHPSDRECVILSCAKTKGETFADLVLRLDRDSRWFITTNETAPRTVTSYERVVETVSAFNRLVKRNEIDDAMSGSLSKAQVGKHLAEAVKNGHLESPKFGHYCTPELTHSLTSVGGEQVSNYQEDSLDSASVN
jgi:RecA-family ATPase